MADAPGWASKAMHTSVESVATNDEVEELGPCCWKCKGLGNYQYHILSGKRKRKLEARIARKNASIAKKNATDVKVIAPTTGLDETSALNVQNDVNEDETNGQHAIESTDGQQTPALTATPVATVSTTTTSGTASDTSRVAPASAPVAVNAPATEQASGSSTGSGSEAAQKTETVTCNVCNGRGRLPTRRKQAKGANRPGAVRVRNRPLPESYVVRGPEPRGGVDPEMGEELCFMVGNWRIFQRYGGHRYSTDDVVTAWVASQTARDSGMMSNTDGPSRCLDLGCGIGSVLMMVAWQFPNAKCVGVEAQTLSASMARRSLQYNDADDRVKVIQKDLRELDLPPTERFELVTGTPPYFLVDFAEDGSAAAGYGGMPSCEQSAPARYEFRGGVEGYCHAASKHMVDAATSRFVVCEGWLSNNHARVKNGARESGLRILRENRVLGREGKSPLFAVYEMGLAKYHGKQPAKKTNLGAKKATQGKATGTGAKETREHVNGSGGEADAEDHIVKTITVRHIGGKRTKEYVELMHHVGMPSYDDES